MNFMIRNFLRGLLIVVPIALTIYFLYGLFSRIDRLLGLPYRGAGFAITIAAITAIGFLGSNIIGRTLFSWTEKLFIRAPFVRIVYGSIKDLLEAFVGEKKRFDKPVLVSFPHMGQSKSIGFVTRETIDFLPLPGHVGVYFPQSYNVAGNLLLIPSQYVQLLEGDAAQLMAFVVSGGVSVPTSAARFITT
ncbi:MAG TPA: DUF502 domain-containing protein [Thermoanaerobaculia bacterium]|nr:DUF502 domain-containing protein [Thermoanaerobaculia bacterium]